MKTELQENAAQIVPLTPDDAAAFRALRLASLQAESSVFAASIEEETALAMNEWRDACYETDERCWIGLFDNKELVGYTLALKWDGDVSGKTALFRSSYIMPKYRGDGGTAMLSNARKQWALRNGYKHAVLFHREGHWIEKALMKMGCKRHHTETMRFADGADALAVWYRIGLG